MADRDIPTAACLAAVQAGQQPRGVVCVGSGIERFLHRGEGMGMIVQIDLHTPDIDETMSGRLLPHSGNRGRLAVEEQAGAMGIDGPGPRAYIGERGDRGRPLSTFAIDDSSAGGR